MCIVEKWSKGGGKRTKPLRWTKVLINCSVSLIKFTPSLTSLLKVTVIIDHRDSAFRAVTGHQKPLARFRAIADSLLANEQIPGGIEPKKYGETRYGSRVTMSERMINTKSIYEKWRISLRLLGARISAN